MVVPSLIDYNNSLLQNAGNVSVDLFYEDIDSSILDDDNDSTVHPIHKMALLVMKLVFPLFVIVGTVCNGLILLLLRRGALTNNNLNIYLSVLAVVDMIFIYTSAFKTWLRIVWGIELLHIGTWSCKLGLFLNHLSLTLSAWIVVVVTWQRWYTCTRPFDRCCQVDNARCGYSGLASLVLVLVGANSYVLFTVELYQGPRGQKCIPGVQHDNVIGELFPYFLLLLYSGLPAVLLLLLNTLLARVLYISRRSLHSSVDTHSRHIRARYNQVTVLLMCLSVSWFVLTTPHTLFKFIERIPSTHEEEATNIFLNVLFFTFLYTNHSINFFLYCVLTRRFRRDVGRLLFRISLGFQRAVHACLCCLYRPGAESPSTMGHQHNHTDSFMPLLEQRALQDCRKYNNLQNRGITEF
ncbi:growth hormone secretagogue receptor type 1 [Biomphalaria glabrata]|nr:growth hormone secretagogue receptor type 1 [Biomphalaria glabrata]